MSTRGVSKRSLSVALAAAAIAAGCVDRDAATGSAASALIQDAVHEQGAAGFYWLPPLVRAPTMIGAFDATAEPEVSLDALGGGHLATYRRSAASDRERISVDPVSETYALKWRTDDYALDPTVTYRFTVRRAGSVVGILDVDLVPDQPAVRNVDTNEFVPLADGHQLNVKFSLRTTADRCAGVVCAPLDACHLAGACDPATGTCSDPPADDGTACDDGLACNFHDVCTAGTCGGLVGLWNDGGTWAISNVGATRALAVTVAPGGDLYVVGSTSESPGIDGAIVVQRISATSTTQTGTTVSIAWTLTLDVGDGLAVAADASGATVAGRIRTGAVDRPFAAYVARVAGDGTLLWSRVLADHDQAKGVAIDLAASYVAVEGAGPASSDVDVHLLKLDDADGQTLWTRSLGAVASNETAAGVATAGGEVFVAGSTSAALLGANPGAITAGFLARYDADGTLAWGWQSGDAQVPTGLAVDGSRVYLVGGSPTADGQPQGYVEGHDAVGGALAWRHDLGAGSGAEAVTTDGSLVYVAVSTTSDLHLYRHLVATYAPDGSSGPTHEYALSPLQDTWWDLITSSPTGIAIGHSTLAIIGSVDEQRWDYPGYTFSRAVLWPLAPGTCP